MFVPNMSSAHIMSAFDMGKFGMRLSSTYAIKSLVLGHLIMSWIV